MKPRKKGIIDMMDTNTLKRVGLGILVPVVAAMCFVAAIGYAAVGNFTVPCTEIRPQNGTFQFPAASFDDGKAKHYVYKHAPNQEVRFFVVKSTDGIIRAALDACDKCFRAKKGYVQQADNMVCINCGLKFRTDKVNVLTGGCNPHPLSRAIKDGKVIISQADVVAGLRYFE